MAAENSAKTAKKVPGTPFKKGRSGNPKGRPKADPEAKEILKAATPDAAQNVVAKLNARQQAFVEAYTGNATAAALAAGYSEKSARVQGRRLITNDNIANAIKEREAQRLAPTIATRQERQEFWTSVLRNEEEAMKNRLKAAELLGKSEGDFLERVEMDMTLSPAAILEQIRGRRE